MTWLGLLLLGVAVADLARPIRPFAGVAAGLACTVVVIAGLVSDQSRPREVAAMVAVLVFVVGWTLGSRRAIEGRLAAWVPLAGLGLGILLAVLLAPYSRAAGGLYAHWVQLSPLGQTSLVDPTQLLLVIALGLAQIGTGNTVVRLMLIATRSRPPGVAAPLPRGALLGPMERMVIFGLGLAGQITAASIVVVAAALVRYPSLQAARREGEARVEQVTEYFLLSSFVSWLFALGSLVVVRL